MGRTAKSTVFIVAGLFLAFSIQGCDKITSFFEYFSPSKEQPSQASPSEVKPMSPQAVKPAEPVPSAKAAESSPSPASNKNVLVRVGNWSLTPQQFKDRLREIKKAYPDYDVTNSQQNSLLLEEMVRQQLMVEAAKEEGLDKNPEIDKAVKEFRKTLLVQEMAKKLTAGITVTDDEVQKYYNDNKKLMVKPTQWHVREIVTPTEEKAKDLLRQLLGENPPSFEDLAQKESIDESAWKKGDLGFISEFPFPKMENAVKALEPGGVSSVFEGPKGFYIVKLEEVKEGEPLTFDEAKDNVKQGLTLMKQQNAIINKMVEMRKKVDFYINEELLQEQGL